MAITLAGACTWFGRADHHRIDLPIHFGEHPAEVAVLGGIRILLKRLGSSPLVDIAQRDDVLARHIAQILRPRPPAPIIAMLSFSLAW